MPDKDEGAKEKEAIALRERFTHTIEDSFGGDSKVVEALLKAANNNVEDVADPDTNVILLTINHPDKKISMYFASHWARSLTISVEKNDSTKRKPRNYTISRIKEITCEDGDDGIFTVETRGNTKGGGRTLTLDINEGTVYETSF
jgi:hypothetical protein